MYTFTLLSALFLGSVLAAPKPVANPQYGPAPAALSTASAPSVILATTTAGELPSFSNIPTSNPSSVDVASTFLASLSSASTSTSTTSASATPTPKRQAGVYICSDVSWLGNCTHSFTNLGTSPDDCTQMDGLASSIGPDFGFTCIFYTNAFCRALASDGSDFLLVGYPGISNLLDTEKGDMNDMFYSYYCLGEFESFE